MARRSARLTVGGRMLLIERIVLHGWRWPRRPPRKGSGAPRPTSGGPAGVQGAGGGHGGAPHTMPSRR